MSIQPDTRIPATDKNIMKAIFSTANRTEANPSEKPVNGYVYGEVYVGTSSLEDKSDIMSWNKFVETYLVAGKVKPITEVGNGNWLKIIDNNGDGKAEYVLHTAYTLDEVADSATRNGTTTYFYNGIDSTDYKFIYLNDYAPAVGDIVLYAVIDGTIQIHKADTAKGTFKAVNYKERQATDVNGDVKEQSDIYNYTRLPQILTSVNENVEYDLYLILTDGVLASDSNLSGQSAASDPALIEPVGVVNLGNQSVGGLVIVRTDIAVIVQIQVVLHVLVHAGENLGQAGVVVDEQLLLQRYSWLESLLHRRRPRLESHPEQH